LTDGVPSARLLTLPLAAPAAPAGGEDSLDEIGQEVAADHDPFDGPIGRSAFNLRPYMASSNRMGAWQILNTLLPYGLLWALALHLLQRGQGWLLPPVIALQVLFLARCFSLMHDCGHHSLFEGRTLNRWIGFLLGVVSGIPQLPWSRGHEFHHRHNGNWEKYQGPSALVRQEVYQDMNPRGQRLYRWLRHPLMLFPGGFFYLVIKPRLALLLGLIDLVPEAITRLQQAPSLSIQAIVASHRSRHWHSPEEFRDLALNNLAVLGLWALMAATVGAAAFWSLYIPVMTCGAAIFICIFFVQHNFPGSYAHRTEGWNAMAGVLEGTSDLDLPAVLNWFSADIGCHAIHHLCSAIPNYRLRACSDQNAHLLQGVKRLSLADIPGCFAYILWDPEAGQLTTVNQLRLRPAARPAPAA
jgi:omega-6 fatty acid desaturase (delta-12 desaturase)